MNDEWWERDDEADGGMPVAGAPPQADPTDRLARALDMSVQLARQHWRKERPQRETYPTGRRDADGREVWRERQERKGRPREWVCWDEPDGQGGFVRRWRRPRRASSWKPEYGERRKRREQEGRE